MAVRVQPETKAIVRDRPKIAVATCVEPACALNSQSLRDDLLEVLAEFKDFRLAKGRGDVPLQKRLKPSDVR